MNALVNIRTAHAVYAPSSAYRWTRCTASAEGIANSGAKLDLTDGEDEEGTEAHEEIARLLKPLAEYGLAEFFIDPNHPAFVGIGLMFDFVRQLMMNRNDQVWIEERTRLTDQIWGTPDVIHWSPATGMLTVADYKNGHVAVNAERNEQLRIYAAAFIATHQLPVKFIRYVIVQPNDFRPVPRVKQWSESYADLYAFAIEVAKIPHQPKTFTPGEHCTYCPLFGRCEATRDILRDVSALVAGLVTPEEITPEQWALFLICEKPIADAFKNAKNVLKKRMLQGVELPGLKLVESTKHRAWSNPVEARALVLAKLGVDALDLPTPAQAIERGLDEVTVHAMAPRPEGSPTLAFANASGKPWKKPVQEMFAGVAAMVAKS
jgi:hypothetical protein